MIRRILSYGLVPLWMALPSALLVGYVFARNSRMLQGFPRAGTPAPAMQECFDGQSPIYRDLIGEGRARCRKGQILRTYGEGDGEISIVCNCKKKRSPQ